MRFRGVVGGSVNGHYAQVGNISVYYEVKGAGEPLMLIHGLSGSGRWWSRNVAALAEHYRVHVVDLAGFGRSRSAPRVALEASGEFLTRLMDVLEIEQASIVGHSMGGLFAASLAADAPARVNRLMLVNAAVLPLRRTGMALRFGTGQAATSVSASFLPVVLSDGLRAGPMSLIGAARDLLQADARAKLNKIAAPTLVIWGAGDRLLPVQLGEEIRASIQLARLQVVHGAGHNPMWDQPVVFNQAILSFMAERALVPNVA